MHSTPFSRLDCVRHRPRPRRDGARARKGENRMEERREGKRSDVFFFLCACRETTPALSEKPCYGGGTTQKENTLLAKTNSLCVSARYGFERMPQTTRASGHLARTSGAPGASYTRRQVKPDSLSLSTRFTVAWAPSSVLTTG